MAAACSCRKYPDALQHVTDYDALLTSEGIEHTTVGPEDLAHTWDGGWVPLALAGLYQDSLSLGT